MAKPSLGQIHERILALLKAHPEGISEGEMRATLRIRPEEQVQFGRRRRELHYHYRIDKKRIGSKTVYIFRGPLARHAMLPRSTPSCELWYCMRHTVGAECAVEP